MEKLDSTIEVKYFDFNLIFTRNIDLTYPNGVNTL